MNLLDAYEDRYQRFLRDIANKLQAHLVDVLEGCDHVDAVTARAKSPDRFIKKAEKKEGDGKIKYNDPLNQIRDQIGARITVFYLKDVDVLSRKIMKYFVPIEIQEKKPDKDSEFGYFGEHFILKIPDDVLPDEVDVPEFFELQIKTLFQHAWSEAHHDLGYKATRDLTALELRKVAFTAAQGWGADRIFQELADDLVFENSSKGAAA